MKLSFPCEVRALKHLSFGNISIRSGEIVAVVESSQQNSSNNFVSVELKSEKGVVNFTSEALKNAIIRGDFVLL